jgi:hypothetical protein
MLLDETFNGKFQQEILRLKDWGEFEPGWIFQVTVVSKHLRKYFRIDPPLIDTFSMNKSQS